MAGQALLVDLVGAGLGEPENLGRIAAPIHVRLARTVATFAGGGTSAMHMCDFGVRILVKALGYVGVTGLAYFRSHKVCGIRSGFVNGGRCLLRRVFSLRCRAKGENG